MRQLALQIVFLVYLAIPSVAIRWHYQTRIDKIAFVAFCVWILAELVDFIVVNFVKTKSTKQVVATPSAG